MTTEATEGTENTADLIRKRHLSSRAPGRLMRECKTTISLRALRVLRGHPPPSWSVAAAPHRVFRGSTELFRLKRFACSF